MDVGGVVVFGGAQARRVLDPLTRRRYSYLAGPALIASRRAPAFHPLHRPAEHGEDVGHRRLARGAHFYEARQQMGQVDCN